MKIFNVKTWFKMPKLKTSMAFGFGGGVAFTVLAYIVYLVLQNFETLSATKTAAKFLFSLPYHHDILSSEDGLLVDIVGLKDKKRRMLTRMREEAENSSLETEAMASLEFAIEMKNLGKVDKAMKLFQHALALRPSHPDILTHYGEFLEEQSRDIVQAEHMYARALIECPTHSRAWENRKRTLPQVEELDRSLLDNIDSKLNTLTCIPENSAALKRIKKEAYFLQIYHTAGIEGNTMTLQQTRSILETKMAIADKSIIEHNEILGLAAALTYVNTTLVQRIGEITEFDLRKIHLLLMSFVDPLEAGVYRKTQVFIAEHIPPSPSEIPDLMNEFVQWLNSDSAAQLHPVKFAALAHYKFVHIHPFVDGNGRTSRLLMNLILMQSGFPPVIIRKQDRQRYYEYLKVANQGDVRPFIRFIAECTERTLDFYLYFTKEYLPQSTVPAVKDPDDLFPALIVET